MWREEYPPVIVLLTQNLEMTHVNKCLGHLTRRPDLVTVSLTTPGAPADGVIPEVSMLSQVVSKKAGFNLSTAMLCVALLMLTTKYFECLSRTLKGPL